ncbi:uncharacterized protein [Bemisia tabaci]|uniref:uncharacterized protein n=1 Tax=Bemisia tabaci TaxID=7038 RepID=UPI003B280B40
MSSTFTLTGKKSILSCNFFPPIELNPTLDYSIGLISLDTYNSIPNIEAKKNNQLKCNGKLISLPTGAYEISTLESELQNLFGGVDKITLKANHSTLKCELKSVYGLDFNVPHSLGSVLGFSKKELPPNTLHISDLPINITTVTTILVECNLVTGAYLNGKEFHTLHTFAIRQPAGFRITQVPSTIIYLPVQSRLIDTLSVKLLDQNGNLLNFRGETITVHLHLKHGL